MSGSRRSGRRRFIVVFIYFFSLTWLDFTFFFQGMSFVVVRCQRKQKTKPIIRLVGSLVTTWHVLFDKIFSPHNYTSLLYHGTDISLVRHCQGHPKQCTNSNDDFAMASSQPEPGSIRQIILFAGIRNGLCAVHSSKSSFFLILRSISTT